MKLILFLALFLSNLLAYGNPLVVGVGQFAPPFSSSIGNSSHYFGFCIDLMNELCARMHETCEYKATELGQTQINDLHQEIIDITFLTKPISLSNTSDYLYSLPYIPSSGQFLTLSGSDLSSLDALTGKKIGVIAATSLKNTFLAKYSDPKNIYEYDNITDMMAALNAHQIDAVLMNASVAKYVVNNIGRLKLLGQPMQLGMGYGIIALRKNAALIDKINKALLQIEADGTYTRIYNKYFGN